jgi:hypothetical protein
LFLVLDVDDTLVETQDVPRDHPQPTNGDQPQSPIIEIHEPESAENPTFQT